MLRGIPLVDLAYLHQKGPVGECAVLQKAEDRTGATVSLTPEATQMVRDGGEQEPRLPYLFPIPQSEGRHGSSIPGIPVGTQGIQPAAGSTQAVPGNAVGTQYLCSQTPGPQWPTICEIHPGIISGSHGALLHHGDRNLSEAFQQQKD